ncbi:uncharacterized protein G2W53_040602 [Senna tora]|uniref:Uncharacterized protein n=1 Tax=Senna tora TaxID=362788 RepID=A0A834SEC2_9FABA|nr:uncharacterized protein G2W53_040602 [Senna tora]
MGPLQRGASQVTYQPENSVSSKVLWNPCWVGVYIRVPEEAKVAVIDVMMDTLGADRVYSVIGRRIVSRGYCDGIVTALRWCCDGTAMVAGENTIENHTIPFSFLLSLCWVLLYNVGRRREWQSITGTTPDLWFSTITIQLGMQQSAVTSAFGMPCLCPQSAAFFLMPLAMAVFFSFEI